MAAVFDDLQWTEAVALQPAACSTRVVMCTLFRQSAVAPFARARAASDASGAEFAPPVQAAQLGRSSYMYVYERIVVGAPILIHR